MTTTQTDNTTARSGVFLVAKIKTGIIVSGDKITTFEDALQLCNRMNSLNTDEFAISQVLEV